MEQCSREADCIVWQRAIYAQGERQGCVPEALLPKDVVKDGAKDRLQRRNMHNFIALLLTVKNMSLSFPSTLLDELKFFSFSW